MLISCPKCHSIYEIPDDLIGKTGQNFRCQACGNVWHALREEALDYIEENDEPPYVEAIPVSSPPQRHFPADADGDKLVLNKKSGARTRSSKELIKDEGDSTYVAPTPQKQKEIVLTSDKGTSFTINAQSTYEEDIKTKNSPRFYNEDFGMHASDEDHLTPPKPFKGYRKTTLFLFLLFIIALGIFMRRDIVTIYPQAETWYNKIYLTGLNNAEYLKFEDTAISEENIDGTKKIKITATIHNPSRYNTMVPAITISGIAEKFQARQTFLKAHEKTVVEILSPQPENNALVNLTLQFVKP